MDPESNESEPIPDGNPECRLDLALLGVWLAASSLTVSAHEMRLKALNIVHPFVFETEQSEAALHVRIKNTSRAAERLLGASTPLATKVSIVDDAGRAAGGLVIPARGELSLKSVAYWTEQLASAGVPSGPINDIAGVFSDPQVRHRGMRIEVEHPNAGRLPLVGSPLRLSSTPVQYGMAPPLLGQHTEEVLVKLLGLAAEEIEALRQANVL